jgi:hypothetical protein
MAQTPRIHLDNAMGFAKVTYDFAEYGGAVGTIDLPLDLPDNAIIWDGVADVVVAPTSGGSATIAFGLNTTTDIKGATAIASYTGLVTLIPVGTAATAVKATAARSLTMTIGTAPLIGGLINIFVNYYLGD